MPWQNQGGGGGPWGGGGGQGPWSRPPGGGGFGSRPPDIEDLIRRGQDKMKKMMPGGFGSGFGASLVVVFVFLIWVASGIFSVQPDELGIVTRFGEYVRQTYP